MGQSAISLIESGARDTSITVANRWAEACGTQLTLLGAQRPELVQRLEKVLAIASPDELAMLEVTIQHLERRCRT